MYDKDGKVVQKGGILKRKSATVQAIDCLYMNQEGKMYLNNYIGSKMFSITRHRRKKGFNCSQKECNQS